MHVFVDESWDLGFTASSSKFFIVAYLECEPPHKLQIEMKRVLRHLHQKNEYSLSRNELKFSRMDRLCRRYVLKKIADFDVNLGVIVLDKSMVNSNLRKEQVALYSWCVVHNVMESLLPYLTVYKKLTMVFDRSLPAWRIGEFNSYLENKASYLLSKKGTKLFSDCISSLHIVSELEPCLQAVDSVAGAYFQKFERQNDEYARLIENKVSSFKYLWRK